MPAAVLTPIQQYNMMLNANRPIMNVFIGPRTLSARYPIIGRAGILMALTMSSRLTASTEENPITLRA
jgi:hypothetical protein